LAHAPTHEGPIRCTKQSVHQDPEYQSSQCPPESPETVGEIEFPNFLKVSRF